MSNSVEYEIAMNEASRREALEAFAILNKKKYTIIERIEKLECKLLDIDDNISTLLDGECYTGNIPSSVIAYFREIQNIISK